MERGWRVRRVVQLALDLPDFAPVQCEYYHAATTLPNNLYINQGYTMMTEAKAPVRNNIAYRLRAAYIVV